MYKLANAEENASKRDRVCDSVSDNGNCSALSSLWYTSRVASRTYARFLFSRTKKTSRKLRNDDDDDAHRRRRRRESADDIARYI